MFVHLLHIVGRKHKSVVLPMRVRDICLGLKEIVKVRIVDFCRAGQAFCPCWQDTRLQYTSFISSQGEMRIWENSTGKIYLLVRENAFFLEKGLHHYGNTLRSPKGSWRGYFVHFQRRCWWPSVRRLSEDRPVPASGEFSEDDYDQYIKLPKLLRVEARSSLKKKAWGAYSALQIIERSQNGISLGAMAPWSCFLTCLSRKGAGSGLTGGDLITRRIILYLEGNVSRKLSSAEISDPICVEYNCISGIFKEKTGMSIMECHRKNQDERRAAEAAQEFEYECFLRVSDRLGFGDPLYFSPRFQKGPWAILLPDYVKQSLLQGLMQWTPCLPPVLQG